MRFLYCTPNYNCLSRLNTLNHQTKPIVQAIYVPMSVEMLNTLKCNANFRKKISKNDKVESSFCTIITIILFPHTLRFGL